MKKHNIKVLSSTPEQDALRQFAGLLKSSPLPEDELLSNLGLYLSSKALARILFFHEIYRKILTMHGVIMEFGVRWGQTLAILSALRGIYEPFNRHRKIIGFDTFEGLKGVGVKDGGAGKSADGHYSVSPKYEEYLAQILGLQEALNPAAHLRKFELVKGDGCVTVAQYLKLHPETIVSLAIFDFDIYRPTKAALEAIKPHLCKGSILVFDELCEEIFPGETVALNEVFGLNNVRIQRLPITARLSYLEVQ